jgi:serine/threonine protein phosphatase 1
VIGDIHGRLDLLDALLARIAAQPGGDTARILFVGDLVDRGPDSAGVLARVHALHKADPDRVLCLMGNHERMMLDFLEDAPHAGPRWIRNGGSDTLNSFGLSPWARRANEDALQDLAEALRSALGAEKVDWLTTLPLIWQEGLLAVTHAGADPKRDMADQNPQRLIWGPRKREAAHRSDGIWVAQGHVIVETAHAQDQRIWVDTGAFRSGQLSAAWIDASGLSFLNISGEK